jgi:hypothetical protein
MSEELREEPEELHEEPVAAEETRTAGTTEERAAVDRPQTRGELIKFGILVLVLVGTVLIVALSRPLIFGHIVPAIMGEGLEQPPPAVEPTDTDTADDPAYPTEAEDTPLSQMPIPRPTMSNLCRPLARQRTVAIRLRQMGMRMGKKRPLSPILLPPAKT